MKILYFTFIENPFAPENTGVMRGQVINLLKRLSSRNQDITTEWLAIINDKAYTPEETEINKLKNELEKANIKLNISFIPYKKQESRWNFALKEVDKKSKEFKPDIVHCRAYPAAYVALKLRARNNFKVIFDPRGIYPEQILERSPNIIGKIRYHLWKHNEKKMLKRADLIIGVSEPFIEHYKEIYKDGNYKTIPCCFEKGNKLEKNLISGLKQNLNYKSNDIIIVYSGNISAKYSSLESIIKIMSQISKIKNDSKFLFLTRSDTAILNNMLEEYKLKGKSKILNLKPEEVHQYLSISDIGILYREVSKVNEVAMPTKFTEYLAAGLPVVTSKSLKGITEVIAKNEVGLILEECKITEDQIDKLLKINKDQCIQTAEKFTTEEIADQYYKEYLKLIK